MALSGSFDFTLNRDQIIKDAFVEAGVLRPDEEVRAEESTFGSNTLNRMLKAFQADGLQVFAHRDATLFLELNKINYQIGPSGDHCTESFTETAIKVAASDTDTTIDVDSTTGMTVADNIGFEMDDGTMHWDTIASITDGDTVVITNGIDDDAAIDNVVYYYTSKVARPLNVAHAFYRSETPANPVDTRMYRLSRDEYLNLSTKNTETQPTEYWFDKQLTNAEINLFGEPNSATDTIRFSFQLPFDDMDAATDNLAFPQEWMEAIHLGLTYRLGRAYRANDKKLEMLRKDSVIAHHNVLGFDEERSDIELRPDRLWLQD